MYKAIKNTKTTLLTALVLSGMIALPGMAAADPITVTNVNNAPVVADDHGNIAAGNEATATAGDNVWGNTAIGGNAKASSEYGNSTAVGYNASASNYGDVAIGSNSEASGGKSAAIGQLAKASGYESVAIGELAQAKGQNALALGANSVATEADTVSVGHTTNDTYSTWGGSGWTTTNYANNLTRRIVNVADATTDSGAATWGQVKKSLTEVKLEDGNKNLTLKYSIDNTTQKTTYTIGFTDNPSFSTMEVTGATKLGGGLTVTGGTSTDTLSVTGDATVGGTLYASDLNLGGQSMLGRMNDLSQSVRDTGAHAAALAALHPQDYDPEDKFSVAAGYGHYAGSHAAALGLYYQPSEDVSIGVGRTFGSGYEGDMWNLGVSFKFGRGKSASTASRTSLTRSVQELQSENAQLKAENEKNAAELKDMKAQMQALLLTVEELKAK